MTHDRPDPLRPRPRADVPLVRRLTASGLILALTLGLPLLAQESSDVREEVEVARVIVDVRVIDRKDAQPIEGLGPGDFRVEVEGRRARIESADWIIGATPSLDGLPEEEIRRVEL